MRVIDDLSKTEFEALVNDALWAELSARGAFWPNATLEGTRDRGYDAAYDGPIREKDRHWRVSAKHSRAKKPVDGLKDLLRPELGRYQGESWLLATNVVLVPAQQKGIRDWAVRRQGARDLEIYDGNGLRQMVRRHGFLTRLHGLRGGLEHAPPLPVPLPPSWEAAVDEVVSAIHEGGHVAVVGPVGSGRRILLLGALDRYRQAPAVDGRGRPFPIWLAGDDLSELDELPLKAARYVVVGAGRQHLLPLLQRGLQVVVLSEGTRDLPGTMRRVEVPAILDHEVEAWTRAVAPALSLSGRARLFGHAGWQVGTFVTALEPYAPLPMQELVEQALGPGGLGLEDQRAQELAALLLIGTTRGARGVDWVVAQVGCTAQDVARTRSELLRRGFLDEHKQGMRAHDLKRAVALRAWQPRGDLALVDDPARALELARLTEWDGPALQVMRRDAVCAAGGDYVSTMRAVERAKLVAPWSRELGLEALKVANAALTRSSTRPVFPDMADIGDAALGADHLELRAWEVIASAAQNTAVVREALDLFERHDGDHDWAARARSLGREAASPRSPSPAKPTFAWLRDRVDPSCAERTVDLCLGAVEPWLSRLLDETGSFGPVFAWQRVALAAEDPQVLARREEAVGLLLRLGEHDRRTTRIAAWRVWKCAWAGAAAQGEPPVPAQIAQAMERALGLATQRLRTIDDWTERAAIEQAVYSWIGRPWLGRARLATAIRAFSSDPLYLAWRLLVEQAQLVLDAAELADAVAVGATWGDVVGLTITMQTSHGAELVGSRLAAHVRDEDAVLTLLERAAAHQQAEEGWGSGAVLEAWIRGAPSLFEDLLFGGSWARVPPAMGTTLLHAARPTFGERMASTLGGSPSSDPRTGALLHLGGLVDAPTDSDPSIAIRLLPALFDILEPEHRAPTLLGLSQHRAERVRRAVVRQTIEWMAYRDWTPDASVVGEVLRECLGTTGAGTEEHLVVDAVLDALDFLPPDRRELYDHAVYLAMDALLLAYIRHHARCRSKGISVVAGWLLDRAPQTWLNTVRQAIAYDGRVPGALLRQPAVAEVGRRLAEQMLREVVAEAHEVQWCLALAPVMAPLSVTALREFLELDLGATGTERLLTATPPRDDPEYARLLADALTLLSEERAEVVVDAAMDGYFSATMRITAMGPMLSTYLRDLSTGHARAAQLNRLAQALESVHANLVQRGHG